MEIYIRVVFLIKSKTKYQINRSPKQVQLIANRHISNDIEMTHLKYTICLLEHCLFWPLLYDVRFIIG